MPKDFVKLVRKKNRTFIEIQNQYGEKTGSGETLNWDNVSEDTQQEYFNIIDQLETFKEYGEYVDLAFEIDGIYKERPMVSAYDQYRMLTGEAQSRLTQARIEGNKEQRRRVPPWITLEKMMRQEGLLQEGQKPEDVLISRDGSGVAMSTGNLTNQDKKYLELAKDPEKNREELQRMVDDAARAAGYDVGPVYHGTYGDFYNFYTPDTMPDDIADEALSYGQDTFGIYFSDSQKFAKKFGDKVLPAYLKLQNQIDLRGADTFESLAKKLGIDIKENAHELKYIKNNSYFLDDGFTDDVYRALESLVKKFSLSKKFRQSRNDGIVFDDREGSEYGTTHIVFNPNQIKSADPITKDADGNIIPLSERFNESRDDIRFSTSSDRVTPEKESKKNFNSFVKNLLPGYKGDIGKLKYGYENSRTDGGTFDLSEESTMFESFKYGIVSKLDPLKKVQESISTVPEYADALTEETLRISKTKATIKNADDKYFTPIKRLIALSKKTVKDVDEFLYAYLPPGNIKIRFRSFSKSEILS